MMNIRRTVTALLMLIGMNTLVWAQGLTLTSKDISGQLSINEVFNGFGCTGKNISPELSWNNVPKGTKSFAISVYDPDAPTGSGWWHWIVFNISKDVRSLKAGAGEISAKLLPQGAVQNVIDYGFAGFGGACPPQGDKAHRYIFTVYALDVEKFDLDGKQSAAIAGYYINAHTIEKASLIAYYGR
jgi:Raf kinase inhibitor-like YbhB/YbcL family protein